MKWIGIVVTSQWLPIALFVVAVGVLAMIHFDLSPSKKKKEQAAASTVQPASSIQPMMPTIPAQDLSYLADPAYDYLWPDSWHDALIKRGQSLVEQWTTRLEYPEKQRREHDSKNWLGEANEFARKHLTSEQMNEFTLRHNMAASGGKQYDFLIALTQAGTQQGSEDANLAFEVFGKVKLLERFRSEKKQKNGLKEDYTNSNKTLIELIDDALADGERVATFCEGFHPGSECQQQANTWIEKTRNVLRERAPNYIAMFNETVKNPFPNPWLPVSGRRVEETAKWFGDQERREAWRVVAATVEQLRTIRSKIRATLPS